MRDYRKNRHLDDPSLVTRERERNKQRYKDDPEYRERLRCARARYGQRNVIRIRDDSRERARLRRQNTPEKCREINRRFYERNRERMREYHRNYSYKQYHERPEVREKIKKQSRDYRARNLDRLKTTARAWRIKNADKASSQNHARYVAFRNSLTPEQREQLLAKNRERRCINALRLRNSDPVTKITDNLRRRINGLLHRGKGGARTQELLGCSIGRLMEFIQAQFTSGMSWSNYGKWHLDHKRPCGSFDLTDIAQQRECFNWLNLRPLWAADNCSKGAKFDRPLAALRRAAAIV